MSELILKPKTKPLNIKMSVLLVLKLPKTPGPSIHVSLDLLPLPPFHLLFKKPFL